MSSTHVVYMIGWCSWHLLLLASCYWPLGNNVKYCCINSHVCPVQLIPFEDYPLLRLIHFHCCEYEHLFLALTSSPSIKSTVAPTMEPQPGSYSVRTERTCGRNSPTVRQYAAQPPRRISNILCISTLW